MLLSVALDLMQFWNFATLLSFLFFAVTVKSFFDTETGVTAQPQFKFFAERNGRADDVRYIPSPQAKP